MYRVIKLGKNIFAMEVNLPQDVKNIEEFVCSGDVVLLTEELYEVAELLNIEEDEIQILEPE